MSETLQVSLAQILTKAVSTVETAGQFLVDEVPEVVHQLLVWKFTLSLVGFIAILIGLAMFITLAVAGLKEVNNPKNKYDNDGPFAVFMIGAIGSIVMVCVLFGTMFEGHTLDWLQIKVAPRIFLIEYASDLIK